MAEERSSSIRWTTRASGEVSRLTPECPYHRGLLGRAKPRCLPGSVRCPRTVDCWCVLQDSAPTGAGGRRLGQFQVAGRQAGILHAGSANRKRSAYVPLAVLCIWRTLSGWSVSQSLQSPCSLLLSDAIAEHPRLPRLAVSSARLLLLLLLTAFVCLRVWKQRADISCHHKLTHDLALVADDWWLMTVCPPENQICKDSSRRPHRKNASTEGSPPKSNRSFLA